MVVPVQSSNNLPCCVVAYFWQFSMWSSGYDIESIVKVSCSADNLNPETRDDTNKYIVAQLDRHITYHRHLGRTVSINICTHHRHVVGTMNIKIL